MLYKNNIILLLIAFLGISAGAAREPAGYSSKWVILKECTVKINGSTNINTFTCSVEGYSSNDTITCFISNDNKKEVAMNGFLALPVVNFDCLNKTMTKEFRKTLKEQEYRRFYIHFISMDRYPLLQPSEECVNGQVIVELAGVKKQMEVNYRISRNNQGELEIKGERIMYFSDFNMAAPRKMGGIVKASNKLTVQFIIHCRVLVS